MAQVPDVPTVAEAGVRDYDGVGILGIAVRTGTPREVVDVFNREINRALATPESASTSSRTGWLAGAARPRTLAPSSRATRRYGPRSSPPGGSRRSEGDLFASFQQAG
jgi:tripartite-type tricarboxylate transporter receptor subunit TctC